MLAALFIARAERMSGVSLIGAVDQGTGSSRLLVGTAT